MKLKSLLFSGLLLVPLFIAGQPGETVQADQAPQGQSELDKIKDVSNYDGPILVNKETKLWKSNPEMTKFTQEGTRALAANTAWYSNFFEFAEENGEMHIYYRVSPNEWIRTSRNVIVAHDNYYLDQPPYGDDGNAKIIKTKNVSAPIYDDYGRKTGKTIPANYPLAVDKNYIIRDAENSPIIKMFQRISTHEWIDSTDDATVTQTISAF
jgi:hypothetical protein